ncbi:alanine--tRNA ligase [Verrucomicrobia bacterium LW23]|nr:alanine--tRNA ligase [Verrucomicrobia bacterium LW23]
MTSAQLRQSFLDFFKEKQHTIVPSSSLLPDAPNLMFTNAGMNQFVPIFLGQSACPYVPGRAADTQKCIRAGGKHNDLEDVGFDTYHHTFFEMLGNWSFGDYFKKEALTWAWELIVERWKFPANRVYATVYNPEPGDPASFDQEAYDVWAEIFTKAGLDPKIHIVYGNKKDNFWMMGETGPCGPCSELHIDLTPEGNTMGSLVNKGDARCIEIWNNVFIQFNAGADGSYTPLPAKHVDTGMGFERVASMMQGTKGFSDFVNARISNYETDIFYPIFDEIEKLTGKKYGSTLPAPGATSLTAQETTDVAFRVIADHIRTLSFAIADGIIPSNTDRGYVLRRILRRAARYGRNVGLTEPFLYKLVGILASTMGHVFPEIVARQADVTVIVRREEDDFRVNLDRGISLFEKALSSGQAVSNGEFSSDEAFKLYDTYGFPFDLTALMAKERGLAVSEAGFKARMEEAKRLSRESQVKEVITVEAVAPGEAATEFVGFEDTDSPVTAKVVAVQDGFLVVDKTPFYAEMGGQVGDTGKVTYHNTTIAISDTRKSPQGIWLHKLADNSNLTVGAEVSLSVDKARRSRIEGHHSATHIMHWALRKILGNHVSQKGSYVGPDRLRFDFSHPEGMKPEQIAEVEALVNQRIKDNMLVTWEERPYAEVKGDASILQFFGDKYGEFVRVVSIGDYSKELCGGTHVQTTGRIGWFKLVSEGAIQAGVRRVEALSGPAVIDYVKLEFAKQDERLAVLKRKRGVDYKNTAITEAWAASAGEMMSASGAWQLLEQRGAALARAEAELREWEKQAAKEQGAELQRKAAQAAATLVVAAKTAGANAIPFISSRIEEPGAGAAYLQAIADSLKAAQWKGVAVLATSEDGKVSLLASVSAPYSPKLQAGKIIQAIAPLVGGKGGGRPELAQGGGTKPEGIAEALAKAESLV